MIKKRLTKKTEDEKYKIVDCTVSIMQVVEKLAEYENLEDRLKENFGDKMTLEECVSSLERVLKEPNSKHPMNARILTYDESAKWDEYCSLEKQELLLKLPCKVGDILYTIYESKILEVKCTGYTIQKDVPNGIDHSYIWIDSLESERDYWRVDFKDFEGKCFLTKSDAEEIIK